MNTEWDDLGRILAKHSRSFSLATRLFDPKRRRDAVAMYAWCRTCDDAIDLAPADTHEATLEELRSGLRSIVRGDPQPDALGRCFQDVVRRRAIPIEYPLELLDGMQMDIEKPTYETVDELLVYCWKVAGSVGLMMCHVMGVSDPRAARHAAHLGIAMQLTNICRDVLEDHERGRRYVPGQLVPRGIDRALAARRGSVETEDTRALEELTAAVRRLLELAQQYYASADAGMHYLEPRCALAVRTARLVYAEIGQVIVDGGYDVLEGRAVVRRSRQLRLLGRATRRFAMERRRWTSSSRLRAPTLLTGAEAVRLT